MIRVLLVDDSVTTQRLLKQALSGQPDLEVVGTAATGVEAVELADKLKPTLITMDIQMPDMNGLVATEQIMAHCPTRIVILSAEVGQPDQKVTFDALQAGALEVLPKPRLVDKDGFGRFRSELIGIVRSMAALSVVRRRRGASGIFVRPPLPEVTAAWSGESIIPGSHRTYAVVGLGASTGGPQALAQIVSHLPRTLRLPILVVQHMSPGFTLGFARWLQGETRLRVKLAAHGDVAEPGTVYIAPDGADLEIMPSRTIQLSTNRENRPFCPSVDALFHSLARSFGRDAIGVLLTGMGSDGASGLLALKQAGGWALAQEGDSCVVNGMPKAAANLGAVDGFVSPSMVAPLLVEASGM